MDKVAVYKEWIYNGEIEKTALNASLKKIKGLMKDPNFTTESAKKIDHILNSLTSKRTAMGNNIGRADMVKRGIKGNKIYAAPKQSQRLSKARYYTDLVGRTAERKEAPVASKKLTKLLEKNRASRKERDTINKAYRW